MMSIPHFNIRMYHGLFFWFLLATCGCGIAQNPEMKEFATPYPDGENVAKAYFAGGCFWCMEPPFEEKEGVFEVVSGYIGGSKENAEYGKVTSGRTEHVEAVEVAYDPQKITYEELLQIYWRNINPTQTDGQFADRGARYKTYIYPANAEERELAEKSKKELEESGKFDKPIATQIVDLTPFFPAEEYHQDYYKKNPAHYNAYKVGSGRAGFLKKTWGE